MIFDQVLAVAFLLTIFVGGPTYVIRQAQGRRKVRKAEAWRVSPAGIQHHSLVASMHRDSLGALSHAEHEALLHNVLFAVSHQGPITWDRIIPRVAAARQMVHDYPNGIPWLTPVQRPTETPAADPVEPDDSEAHLSKKTQPSLSRK